MPRRCSSLTLTFRPRLLSYDTHHPWLPSAREDLLFFSPSLSECPSLLALRHPEAAVRTRSLFPPGASPAAKLLFGAKDAGTSSTKSLLEPKVHLGHALQWKLYPWLQPPHAPLTG